MINKKQLTDFLRILNLPYSIINRDGYFTEVNKLYCELYDYTPGELLGNHFTMLFAKDYYDEYHEKRIHAQEYFYNSFKKRSTFYKHPVPYSVKNKNGESFNIYTISFDFTDENNEDFRLAIDYISENFFENYDIAALNSKFSTGKFASMDHLGKEIEKHIIFHAESKFSLFNINILNHDIHSESIGKFHDLLFTKLKSVFGKDSKIAIIGTHHFVVFYKQSPDQIDIENKAKNIIKFFGSPIKVEEHFIKESVKIGICTYDGEEIALLDLFNKSELALKYSNIDEFLIYDESLMNKLNDEFQLNSLIFNAYKNDEFIPFFQPYYSIETGEIIGAETLLRLNTKSHGMIPPVKFIPVLEKTYFIIEVEKTLIKRVFQYMKEWQNKGIKTVPISINLSPLQFKNYELLDFLKEAVLLYDIDPKDICFEITESMFIDNVAVTQYMLEELRQIGFKISIDDFGTGYSSLQYLNEFPIDNLKIDLSFIQNIDVNKSNQAIVSAVISMAKHFDMNVICEGVETESELKKLRELGADSMQGYLKARPMDVSSLLEHLTKSI